jgi:hypothetical protein
MCDWDVLRMQFGEFAEHDGSPKGGCRCQKGYVPVNGQCVREGREAMKYVGTFYCCVCICYVCINTREQNYCGTIKVLAQTAQPASNQ